MPKEYHYEPLSQYTKDDFQQLRCCWMMVGYYVMKRRRKWNEISSNMNKVRYKTEGLSFENSTFGKQLKQLIDDSTEECLHEGRFYYKDQLFYNDDAIEQLQIEYFTPDPSEEGFNDLEIYDKNDKEVQQQYFKDDVKNNFIKKAIRWKMKQHDVLKHLPYFESEEERKKRVR
jgi:hypothetical protein